MTPQEINELSAKKKRELLKPYLDGMKLACKEMQGFMKLKPALVHQSNNILKLWGEVQDGARLIKPEEDREMLSYDALMTLQDLGLWKGDPIPEMEKAPKQKKQSEKEPIQIPGKEKRTKKRKGDLAREDVEKVTSLVDMRKILRKHDMFKDLYEQSKKSRDLISLKDAAYTILDRWEQSLIKRRETQLKKAKINQQSYVAPWFVKVISTMNGAKTKPQITKMVWDMSDGVVPKTNLTRYVSTFLSVVEELGLIKRDNQNRFTRQFDDVKNLIKKED